MTDRELLENAARAAGIEGEYVREHFAYGDEWVQGINTGAAIYWSPLADDGDAFRLAVNLGLIVNMPSALGEEATVKFYDVEIAEPIGVCRYAATRRAIVRAAAEIGSEQPDT